MEIEGEEKNMSYSAWPMYLVTVVGIVELVFCIVSLFAERLSRDEKVSKSLRAVFLAFGLINLSSFFLFVGWFVSPWFCFSTLLLFISGITLISSQFRAVRGIIPQTIEDSIKWKIGTILGVVLYWIYLITMGIPLFWINLLS